VAGGGWFVSGGETHWLLQYYGVGLDAFSGRALYVGPTFYWRSARSFAVSVALSIQVAGGAVDFPGTLNLRNFERQQARLRF
jgi:hypothetical protein